MYVHLFLRMKLHPYLQRQVHIDHYGIATCFINVHVRLGSWR